MPVQLQRADLVSAARARNAAGDRAAVRHIPVDRRHHASRRLRRSRASRRRADGSLAPFFVRSRPRGRRDQRALDRHAAATSAGRVLFDSGGAWQLLQSDGDFLFTFRSSVGGPLLTRSPASIRRFTAGDVQLYRRISTATVRTRCIRCNTPSTSCVMIHLLSQGKGVEVHGCGLLDPDGRAHTSLPASRAPASPRWRGCGWISPG